MADWHPFANRYHLMTSESKPVVRHVRWHGIDTAYEAISCREAIELDMRCAFRQTLGSLRTVQVEVRGPNADCEWQTVTVTPEIHWRISGMRGGE